MALCFHIAGDVGIEPTLEVLETSVLPLNESPSIFTCKNETVVYHKNRLVTKEA